MLVKIKHPNFHEAVWYEPEDGKLVPGCKIYNYRGGWCCYCASDEVLEVREDLDAEDLYTMTGRDSDGDFSFLSERIDLQNIGEAFKDNSFLMEDNPSEQLRSLLEDTLDGEYTPIGVCLSSEVEKDYCDIYRPIVLENNKGERINIHIPYDRWVAWSSLQKRD